LAQVGIVDSIKGDEAEVRVKSLRFREKLENLQLVKQLETVKPKSAESGAGKARRAAQICRHGSAVEAGCWETAAQKVNVIGQTTDEAVDAVDKFLDEASLASLNQVRIVHGHGTGALRKAIAELLKDHPHVARFTPAPQDQGGSGATLVELRQ
jgi:DNA mismatch repair protein MutS2